jgi:hypothetical protein
MYDEDYQVRFYLENINTGHLHGKVWEWPVDESDVYDVRTATSD